MDTGWTTKGVVTTTDVYTDYIPSSDCEWKTDLEDYNYLAHGFLSVLVAFEKY